MLNSLFKATIAFCVACCCTSAHAQSEVDALRYANTSVAGTARSLGMGGAFGAIGADLSGIWNNPAGLALYRSSAIEFSLGFNDAITSTRHFGSNNDDSKFRTNLQSLGFVGTKQSRTYENVRYFFGFGVANLGSYNQSLIIDGNVPDNTLLNVFAGQAAGTPYEEVVDFFPFGAGLAWNTFLIDPLDTLNLTYIPAENQGNVHQRKVIDRQGRHTETSFSFGLNVNEQFMLGITLGARSVFFRETSTYQEIFTESNYLDRYTFQEDINASGNGFVARIGGVYRVSEFLRLGLNWQSPTNIVLSDAYSTSMNSIFRDGSFYDDSSPEAISNFNVRIPARYMASAAFIAGKAGVISADYELTDFSNIRMGNSGFASEYDYSLENETIEAIYRSVHRVRVGAEFRVGEVWRLRSGVIYQTSPFVNGVAINDAMMTYTIGGGFRKGAFFADIGGSFAQFDESYWIYDPGLIDQTTLQNTRLNFLLSIGLRF